MNKIHILGGPGSGKSYLADQLSTALDVPHLDLDEVCWVDGDFERRRSRDERAEYLRQFTATYDGWIVEGAYCGPWIAPSLDAADQIIRLDVAPALQKLRLLRRLGGRAVRGQTSFVQAFELIRWVDGFQDALNELPDSYSAKATLLIGRRAAKAYLGTLSHE